MSGKWVRGGERPNPQAGEIVDLRPYELHGTRYFAVLYRLDADPEHAREARVSFDMIYDDPRPGDRVLVESVLSVVDRVTRSPV
ncbi:MAG TPA: hypothetical protein VFH62_04040 [Dehalococcoidia bacterium]|nr:hypothetical protein [Dehalococcoidia bacterium]